MYLNSTICDIYSCGTCMKSDVCKYKEERNKFNVELISVPSFLSIEVKCKYHQSYTNSAITYNLATTDSNASTSIGGKV